MEEPRKRPEEVYRYLAIENRSIIGDTKIILRSKEIDGIQENLQNVKPENILVYELKYSLENALCAHGYEDDKSETKMEDTGDL